MPGTHIIHRISDGDFSPPAMNSTAIVQLTASVTAMNVRVSFQIPHVPEHTGWTRPVEPNQLSP